MTPAEALVAISVAGGEWADFGVLAEPARALPGTFLRQVVIGTPLPQKDHQAIAEHQPGYAAYRPSGDFAPIPVAAAGVRIRGAGIAGVVDLSDCAGPGGAPLAPLALEQCRLRGREGVSEHDLQDDTLLVALDLSRATIASVSLRDSAFTYVAMFHARVGVVNLSGARPLAGWTDEIVESGRMDAFRGAMRQAAAAVRRDPAAAAFSSFLASACGEPDLAEAPVIRHPHAYCWVDLSGSRIDGGLLAQNVRLRVPRRDFAARADVRKPPRFALRLEAAVVAGPLDARGGSVFDGGLSVYLAEVRDEVWLGGARLLKEQGIALDAQGARLGGVFAVADPPLRALGTVFLNSARIAGHVHLRAIEIDGDGSASLVAESMSIGGDLTLGVGAALRGPVGLSGTTIGGALDLRGTIISGGVRCLEGGVMKAADCDALHARNLTVGRDALLSGEFIAHGCVALSSARIGEALDFRGATLAGARPNPYRNSRGALHATPASAGTLALLGPDMTLGGSLRFGGRDQVFGFVAQGAVSLQRASIGKDLDIINACIAPGPPGPPRSGQVLDLGWAAVSGTLILESNTFDGVVSLEHASTKILADHAEGRGDGYGGAPHLRLNGFTYEAFYEPPDEREDAAVLEFVAARARWLGRMPRYRPQPYANLARVLVNHGRPDEARDMLVEKYRRERHERVRRLRAGNLRGQHGAIVRSWLLAGASWVWGILFGYGLKPSRAIVTLLCAFLVGWGFFSYANVRGAMVIDQQPIAGYVLGTEMGALRAETGVDGRVRCGDSIGEALYALDVFIPLVDLRQESKCEMEEASNAQPMFQGFVVAGTRVLSEIQLFQYAKALYALSGWLLISLSILTFAGVLQRRDSEE